MASHIGAIWGNSAEKRFINKQATTASYFLIFSSPLLDALIYLCSARYGSKWVVASSCVFSFTILIL
jgi:hypothetical protein